VFFVYWIYFESTTGQSLGKMALKIKTTNLAGGKPDIWNVAIQSFGKAFLLPIDVLLGWIFTNDKRQRIFSRAGNTSNEGQKWRQQPECPLQKGWLGSLFSFEASK
jgi:uncharacterized RDD family membrane protein YckC